MLTRLAKEYLRRIGAKIPIIKNKINEPAKYKTIRWTGEKEVSDLLFKCINIKPSGIDLNSGEYIVPVVNFRYDYKYILMPGDWIKLEMDSGLWKAVEIIKNDNYE